MSQTVYGVLIPFLGTSLGAACVFFMRRQFSDAVQRVLIGFAAGVMVAASVWSLLIPAIEQNAVSLRTSFLVRPHRNAINATGYPNKFTAPCLFPKFKNSEWLYLILFADDGSCHLENSDGRLLQNSRWLFPLSD